MGDRLSGIFRCFLRGCTRLKGLLQDPLEACLGPSDIFHAHFKAFNDVFDIGHLVVVGVAGYSSNQLSLGFFSKAAKLI